MFRLLTPCGISSSRLPSRARFAPTDVSRLAGSSPSDPCLFHAGRCPAQTDLSRPASDSPDSRRRSALTELSRFYGRRSSLSTNVSPFYRFAARRSLKSAFPVHDFSNKNFPAETSEREAPDLPDSLRPFDSFDGTAPGENRSLLRLNSSTAGSIPGWLGGAGAVAVLLLIAASVPAYDDDRTILDASVLSKTISEVWSSAMDFWKRATVVYDSFWNTVSSVFIKSFDAAVAMAVLVRCVNAVLFTKGEDYANELALRWRLRVISLLADLAGSSHLRRRALVQAGNGSVVDWLLEAVGHGELEYRLIQAEAARAISYFLSDAVTCEELLGRPDALSHLLLFTASIQPSMNAKTLKHKKLELFLESDERTRGRSMLVAAIMDIITSSCETGDKNGIRPKLSGSADAKDVTAALKVLQEGGLHLDESQDVSGGSGEDNGGLHGIGMTVLGGTSVVGVQSQSSLCSTRSIWAFLPNWGAKWWSSDQGWQDGLRSRPDFLVTGPTMPGEPIEMKGSTGSHGLWDDLQGRYVAVPLAAWAVATWAQASSANCAKIAELDKDGDAILAAVMAPERTVKWHGANAARFVLENGFDGSAVPWSSALLKTARQASEVDDAQLALVTLDSFYSCVRKCAKVREVVSENSLPLLRDIAKQTSKSVSLQKVIAQILEILSFSGVGLSLEEGKKWSSVLLHWTFNHNLEDTTRSTASRVLAHLLEGLGPAGVPLSQAWLAMVILDAINGVKTNFAKGDASSVKGSKSKGLVQSRANQMATQAANELAKVVWQAVGEEQGAVERKMSSDVSESDWGDLAKSDIFHSVTKGSRKDKVKLTAADAADTTLKAMKALTELSAEDKGNQLKIIETGGLHLLRRFMLNDDYEKLSALEMELKLVTGLDEDKGNVSQQTDPEAGYVSKSKAPPAVKLRKHAARMLSILSLQPWASASLKEDELWCRWLEDCANNQIPSCNDSKTCSYARATLLNLEMLVNSIGQKLVLDLQKEGGQSLAYEEWPCPHYEDKVFLFNTDSPVWRQSARRESLVEVSRDMSCSSTTGQQGQTHPSDFEMDVVFVHGLCGGPFKTWRIADDKASATGKAGLVEKIDIDSGREGTCWPKQWLATDIPACRLLTVKYKTNLSQWSGATLPLQEVSAMLLDKLLAAGVGERPVVFITHSMGGLVVKQMLMQAGQDKARSHIVKNTSGIVFYSCPHFGSKLADVPWRFGLVLRPAPSIGELRSGSTRLDELNQFIRTLHKGGLEVLSFSETKVTPLVEGYGGWALRMEVVPIESAYPGFGELVVLDGTDHVNSCKPLNRDDAAYTQTLQFLQKLSRSAKTSRR